MLLVLIRNNEYSDSKQTLGNLLIDGKAFCSTIEPPRGWASGPLTPHPSPLTGNKGCIPMGWYKIRVTYSPKFKRNLPLLHMVPGFEGIRIHAGLSVKNTSGCICVGVRANEDKLTELLTKVQARHEEIYIRITDSDSRSELGRSD